MTSRVRVTVDRVDQPHCGMKVGDSFDVDGSNLTMPTGSSFCIYAMAAVFPVLAMKMGELDPGDWLERKPYIACPDPTENVVMRLERVVEPAV